MTKPIGPIPTGFAADDDSMLLIGGERADALVDRAGSTPLFVYDRGIVDAKAAAYRRAFPAVDLHYAVKANPYPPLLRHMMKLVDGFDLASGGEMETALAEGAAAEKMSFAGPGKRDTELEAAIRLSGAFTLDRIHGALEPDAPFDASSERMVLVLRKAS